MGSVGDGRGPWWRYSLVLLHKQNTKCPRNPWTSIRVKSTILAYPVLVFPRFPLVTTVEDRSLS